MSNFKSFVARGGDKVLINLDNVRKISPGIGVSSSTESVFHYTNGDFDIINEDFSSVSKKFTESAKS